MKQAKNIEPQVANLLIKEYQGFIRKINEAIAGDVSEESNEEDLALGKLFEKNFEFSSY